MTKRKSMSVNYSALFSILFFASAASASTEVDQSQLSYNVAMGFGVGGAEIIGQSFQAGVSGLLTDIDVYSNGPVQGGSNAITLELLSGNGQSGPVLGTVTENVSSIANANLYLLDINTQSLNLKVTANTEYTFLITNILGPGDLVTRGLLVDAANPYANGQAYFGSAFGNLPTWDLAFQTQVNPAPIPASVYLFAAGLLGIASWPGRQKNNKGVHVIQEEKRSC